MSDAGTWSRMWRRIRGTRWSFHTANTLSRRWRRLRRALRTKHGSVIYDYDIPDLDQPIPDNAPWGPSGRLRPFVPPPISAEQVIGRTVEEICPNVGTYGMGGPGFFGLRLGSEWLVIPVWGAGEWMTARGRCVRNAFHHQYGHPRPWLGGGSDELSVQLVGQRVRSIDVRRHSLRIVFENGFDLTIEGGSDHRPMFEGTKEPRLFTDNDDLRKAVFLAPTDEIWV